MLMTRWLPILLVLGACSSATIGDGDGDVDGDGDGDTDVDGDLDSDGDTDLDGDSDGDGDADVDGDSDADGDTDADSDEAPDADFSPPDRRVGIFYLTWHAFAADAIHRVPEGSRLTVEAVIGDPSLAFSDQLLDHGLVGEARSFHYHSEPELGFYCLYRRRPTDPVYSEPNYAPDCPEASAVARAHAEQLWSAGVDFVYVDLTNLPVLGEFSDVLGLRPLEVLLEEWAALRGSGTATPQVAAWLPASVVAAGETPMYQPVLDLYDDPAFEDVLLRHEPTGQPILFVVNHGGMPPEPAYLEAIEARGVIPVRLWGNLDGAALSAGTAGWMQPCRAPGGGFTTLVNPGSACDQGYSATTPIGTVLSVSASYQVGYASLPFQASGRLGGLTLQKQFEAAFALQPDYLLVNAWNEHIAQPQPNPNDPALGPLRRSMGVTDVAADDGSADWLWVDMYGHDLSRDIEPTVEGGDSDYQLLRSCLRVYRAGRGVCDDASEPCCQLRPGMTLVHSLRVRGGGVHDTDHLLTASEVELRSVLDSGAWEEICNPFYGPPGLCGGGRTGDGPFLLHPEPGPARAALLRCFTGVDHFFSLDPTCEGTTVEGTLGYLSTVRSSETPRPLRRCYDAPAQVHFHWLDDHCPAGVSEEAILGYAR